MTCFSTDGVLHGSLVKETLERKRPAFSERFHGYRSFTELLEDAQKRSLLEVTRDGRSGGSRPSSIRAARARAQLERVLGTNRAVMTEADGMCAAILRRYERDRWPSLVAQIKFDPASTDTVQNALFSTPLIERRPYRRVLIVTTPVRHGSGAIDNHAERTLLDFRAARARSGGRYLLGAVGCPYVDGGPSWASFEEEER